jgi:DNA-binding IclR family transcriptional regulator
MARVTSTARRERTHSLELAGDELPVQGLVRGLLVLRVFKPGEGSLSHSEITDRTGLPNATVSRLTQTLTALGYLAYIPKLGRYTLGPAVVSLCHSLITGMPYRNHARPTLQALADMFKLPVSLGARDQLDMINIETVRHSGAPSARFDIGARIPIGLTAMGRAYLFGLPENERIQIMNAILKSVPGNERRTISKGFDMAFNSLTKHGFCTSLGDWRADVWGVAASVVTADGVALAINCGGHPNDLSTDLINREIGPRVAAAAAEINHVALG